MLRLVTVATLALGLSGCGMVFDYSDPGGEPKPFDTTLGVSIPPSQAMAMMPPGAGQVIAVIERRRGNAIQHDITLAGAPPNFGENQINVTAFRYVEESAENPKTDALKMERPDETIIYNEMQERIPGGALPTSNAVPRNAMGSFGYAFGRRNGANCLYAWQWIDSGQARPFTPFASKTPAPVSVRVRLCKPGMTEEVMVDFVRQMFVAARNDDAYRVSTRAPAPSYGYGAGAYGSGYRPIGGGLAAAPNPYANPYANPYGGAMPPTYDGQSWQTTQTVAPKRVATVRKKVVRRVVRRVVPVETYSQAPVTVPSSRPAQVMVSPGGYSAVPMPQ